jgi:hypothetical protein
MDPDEPLGEHPALSNPLLKVFYRRKRYDVTAPLIAKMRRASFRDVPIDQLVSLAWFSTPRELKIFGVDNPTLPSLVFQKYVSEGKHDLFHDWQMFCKAIKDPGTRSEYLVGLWSFSISIGTSADRSRGCYSLCFSRYPRGLAQCMEAPWLRALAAPATRPTFSRRR